MPRIARLSLPGVPLHVVQRGNNRQPCFFQPVDYFFYLKKLFDCAARYQVAIHAYVLMTNHVHILGTPKEKWAMSKMMQLLGATYVARVNASYQRTGSLWESRFRSSLVDTEHYCLACYRYIELNPVRAGICALPGDYPWSSYRVNALGQVDSRIDPHVQWLALAATKRGRCRAYRNLVEGELDQKWLERIRYGVRKGLPTGSDRFKSEIENALERQLGDGRRGRPRNAV